MHNYGRALIVVASFTRTNDQSHEPGIDPAFPGHRERVMLKEASKLLVVVAFLGSTVTFYLWKTYSTKENCTCLTQAPAPAPAPPDNRKIAYCASDNILKTLVKSRVAAEDFGIDQMSDCLSNYIRRHFIREPPKVFFSTISHATSTRPRRQKLCNLENIQLFKSDYQIIHHRKTEAFIILCVFPI